ncbi:MAG: gamma-glutamylcyclotransferase family protein [Burkholderiaceae bacterium]
MPHDTLRNSAPAASPRHVFVYGTLRRGDDNDMTRLAPAPRYVGSCTVPGTMYHLGAYPGVVLGGEARVVGEVYAVEPALERQLDEIEELYPQQKDEYFKREIAVDVQGQRLMCVVYEINPRYIAGARVIASGDWVKDRRG